MMIMLGSFGSNLGSGPPDLRGSFVGSISLYSSSSSSRFSFLPALLFDVPLACGGGGILAGSLAGAELEAAADVIGILICW